MSKKLKIIIILIPVLLIAGFFGFSFLNETTYNMEGRYWYGIRFLDSYVCTYVWDGSEEGLTVQIPETVEGKKVTALGGGNAPFYFIAEAALPEYQSQITEFLNGDTSELSFGIGSIPGDDFEQYKSSYDDIIYVDFTLEIGPDISSIYSIADDVIEISKNGTLTALVSRVRAECDPDNKTYYSENGVLYERKTGREVSGFRYTE